VQIFPGNICYIAVCVGRCMLYMNMHVWCPGLWRRD